MAENQIKVLFVCVHNAARSQMAEAFLNQIGGKNFMVESAGLEPTSLNKNVVEVMNEIGIDISNNVTKGVFNLFKQGKEYDYVITVCDKPSAEKCPLFPGKAIRFHWDFVDPSNFTGSQSEVFDKTRNLRDQIKIRVKEFINVIGS